MSIKQDQEAFAVLYKRYAHLAMGVGIKYLKTTELAQNAVQNVFMRLWTDLNQYQIKHFKAWLYQTVKNHCLGELRKKDPNSNLVSDWDFSFMEYEETLHHKVSEENLLLHLNRCLKTLRVEQMMCVEHFYLQQKSYEQTAEVTGYTAKEVKSYLQNGRRNLKNCIKQKLTDLDR